MIDLNFTNGTLETFSKNVLDTFPKAKSELFDKHPWSSQFRRRAVDICRPLASSGIDRVEAFCGKGRWGEIAWIGFSKSGVAPSWSAGLYVAVFFSAGGESLILSLQQGVEELVQALGIPGARKELQRRRSLILADLKPANDFSTDTIDLHAKYVPRGKMYETGHILGKTYTQDLGTLISDLKDLLEYYETFQPSSPAVQVAMDLEYVNHVRQVIDGFVDTEFKFRKLVDRLSQMAVSGDGPIDCGSFFTTTLAKRRIGQYVLRRALFDVYESSCAACGNNIFFKRSKTTTYLVEAAHVLAVSEQGGMLIRNSILLCPNHHWAFDNFLWTITEDRHVQVAGTYLEHPFLKEIDGRPLSKPRLPKFALADEAIFAHQARFVKANQDTDSLIG